MKKVMMMLAVMAVASVAMAGEVKLDFDGAVRGSGQDQILNIQDASAKSQVPEVLGRVKAWGDYDDGQETNVFIRGNKCNGVDCESCACSSSCNTKTCGKKSARTEKSAPKNMTALDAMVKELSAERKKRFFDDLMFVDGKLASIYTADIEKFLGKNRLNEVLKFFNLKTDTGSRQNENGEDENGDGLIDSDYVRQSKCDGAHNCEPASGYNCTENC